MSTKTVTAAILAVVFGLACAIGVKAFLESQVDRTPRIVIEKEPTTLIVVAKHAISRGKTISADDLELKEWPSKLVTNSMIDNIENIAGRTVQFSLFEGEPVLDSKLTLGSIVDMASHLSPGMRAFTIHIPTIGSGVAGFIMPGNRVDVLLTVSDLPSLKETGPMTVTLLQGVELLAVDQQTEAPASNKMDTSQMHSVTLAVTASQSAKLALAGSRGTLTLALRNPLDEQEQATEPVTLSDLQYLKDTIISPIAPRVMQIRTLRGNQNGITSVYPLYSLEQNLSGLQSR